MTNLTKLEIIIANAIEAGLEMRRVRPNGAAIRYEGIKGKYKFDVYQMADGWTNWSVRNVLTGKDLKRNTLEGAFRVINSRANLIEGVLN